MFTANFASAAKQPACYPGDWMSNLTASIPDPATTDRELAGIVRHFNRARVLVVGDVILDRYRIGEAQRLSPEAPIPVLRPTRHHDTLGGAANVAMNVVTLGGRAVLAGVIGDDD